MPWYEYSPRPGMIPLPLVGVQLSHAGSSVRVSALVDSGADHSLLDVRYADLLGLGRAAAQRRESLGAGGATFPTYRWPSAPIELRFERQTMAFVGSFVQFPSPEAAMNLLGCADFFQPFIVQFWDAAGLMNIDLSPDFPRPALGP